MTTKKYTKFELASNQLETAIMLFITGRDRFSVVTLAGAADEIFSQLVTRAGKENFTDILLKDSVCSRNNLAKGINEVLAINRLKHFDPGEAEDITINIEECALAAVLRALVNYNQLEGHNEMLVKVLKHWVETNYKEYINNNDKNETSS